MANYTLTVSIGRFNSLQTMYRGWLLEIPTSAGIKKGQTLTIQELDSSNVATGRYMYAIMNRLKNGEFWNQATTSQWLYFDNIMTYPWIDYTATSTIVGWSAFTTKKIWYCIVGNVMFVQWDLMGTSNNATTTFTLPQALNSAVTICLGYSQTQNNGTTGTSPGRAKCTTSSNLVTLHNNWSGAAYANTGTKGSTGTIIVQI